MKKFLQLRLLNIIDYAKWKLSEYERRIRQSTQNHNYKEHNKQQIYSHYLECYQDNWEKAKCLFCLSTGRTGTMTLARLLSLSPDINANHEPDPRLIYTSIIAQQELGGLTTPEKHQIDKWRLICLAARDDYVFRSNQNGKIYAEMNNYLTYLSWGLKAAFPGSKFVHIYRNPYDFIISGVNRGYFKKESKLGNYKGPTPRDKYFQQWNELSDIEKCAWLWSSVNEDAIRFRTNINPNDIIVLKFENTITSDDSYENIYNLFEFLDAQPPSQQEVHYILEKKLNRQHSKSIDNTKSISKSDLKKINRIIQPTAEKLGYNLVW